MEYSTYFGDYVNHPKIDVPVVLNDRDRSKYSFAPEYRRERLQVPTGFIKHSEHTNEIRLTLDSFNKFGYWKVPNGLSEVFKRHLWYFRANLELYDIIVKDKVFSRDEIYYRCLEEGNSFTKFIKKSRRKTLQYFIAYEEHYLDEHIHEEYNGYDSIIHERYLIYWDDSEEIEDYKYSMIEPGDFNSEQYEQSLTRLFVQNDIFSLPLTESIRILEPVANKKSVKGEEGKTTLLKNTWEVTEPHGMYAIRKIVPTFPGSTRDTGVPDTSTLCMLKYIHTICREVCEKLPNSANCKLETFQKRVSRVLKGDIYLHVDFKKFGLTVNRKVANIALKVLGKQYLSINDVNLEDQGQTLKTKRGGGSLGWLDPLFSIGVIAILQNLKNRKGWRDMDFIVFNDDVEIAFTGIDPIKAIIRKEEILTELEQYDFILSYRKIFISDMSIFLENYVHAEKDNLDMQKLQLAVKPYAKSLVSPFGHEAKLYYSEGYTLVQSGIIRELCQNTISQQFEDEYVKPVELGGWTREIDPFRNLNNAFSHASVNDLEFFLRIQRYKEPPIMDKWVKVNFKKKEAYIENNKMDAIAPSYKLSDLDPDTKRIISQHAIDAWELEHSEPPEEEEESESDGPPPLPRRPGFRDEG